MTEETLFIVGDLVMFSAVVGVLVFTLSYMLFFAWRKTHAGKALMYFTSSLALWAVQSFAARINPDYPGRPWSRVVVYLLISVTVWGLVVTLWRSWNKPFEVHPRHDFTEE